MIVLFIYINFGNNFASKMQKKGWPMDVVARTASIGLIFFFWAKGPMAAPSKKRDLWLRFPIGHLWLRGEPIRKTATIGPKYPAAIAIFSTSVRVLRLFVEVYNSQTCWMPEHTIVFFFFWYSYGCTIWVLVMVEFRFDALCYHDAMVHEFWQWFFVFAHNLTNKNSRTMHLVSAMSLTMSLTVTSSQSLTLVASQLHSLQTHTLPFT